MRRMDRLSEHSKLFVDVEFQFDFFMSPISMYIKPFFIYFHQLVEMEMENRANPKYTAINLKLDVSTHI